MKAADAPQPLKEDAPLPGDYPGTLQQEDVVGPAGPNPEVTNEKLKVELGGRVAESRMASLRRAAHGPQKEA